MAINNIDATGAPESMVPWIRVVEELLKAQEATIAAQQTQINSLTNRN